MRDWPVEAVCSWLESLSLRREIVSCFNDENISGFTLANLTETKIQKFCPMAKYGDIDKILQSRDDKLAECPAKELKTTLGVANELGSFPSDEEVQSEAYQRFGCRAKASFKYTQNAQLVLDSQKADNLLEPRRWFVDIDKAAILNVRDCFSSGAIPFICACLNERSNGTCHIGVDRDGTIHGIQATCHDFQTILQELIDSCFYQDQLDVVRKCVQPVRLVEVTSRSSTPDQSHSDRLYVIELDVISSHAYCTDEAFFAKTPKQNSTTKETQCGELFRFVDGIPQPVSGPDLVKFMATKENLAMLRKKQEESGSSLKDAHQLSQLSEKLEHLLCLKNDVYPIFVTNPTPADQTDSEDFISNMQFLKSIERKVVFDFDDASLPTSLYCNHEQEPAAPIRVLLLQSIDEDRKDKPTMNTKEFLNDCYESSNLQPWIFCNGHQPTQQKVMEVHQWKHNRRPDFLKAVEFFHEAIRPEYTVVVFLLFSNNYEVMLSAAEEFCLKFPNTWVLICETKEIAYHFKEYLVKTQHIIRDEEEFDQHCIIGMPWLHVNQSILQRLGNISAGQVILPNSTGGSIVISKRLLNDLGDLEILSADHLSNLEISLGNDADKLRTMSKEKQKRFYQGDEVDWWNFWFETHVLRRDILGRLLDSTNSALSGLANETGERVSVVAIYHQPGSGGTTIAKNVLWDLKGQYRCAVVKTITSDTSDQVSRLFKEGEPCKPKPVLLLLDNVDEKKVRNLKTSLEIEAKNLSKEVECTPPVPFVLLVCIRCSSESRAAPKICHRRHNIEHNLSSRELTWFKDKYEEMEKKWAKDDSLDPRVLISFNILRENFSQAYITSTVPRLVGLVTDSNERLVLKYVAFLGMYDPECQYIPTSCFDCFMSKGRCFDGSPGWLPSDSMWTNRISDYLRVLLNQDNRRATGLQTKGIKIIHSLISREVFRELVPAEVPASEVMLELLHSEMFRYKDLRSREMLKIVYNVSIKRVRGLDGQYENDFSPLIQSIVSDPKQDKERAVEILKRAFQLTENVFVVQHLVRFYIHVKEWKSAEDLAKTMTTGHPKESVLWNTYGHVLRDQLNHRLHDKTAVTAQEAEESLDLVTNSLDKFIKEQEVLDSDGSDSAGGLLGQGSIILRYIELLTRIPELQEKELHEFLLYPGYVPQCLMTWSEKSVKIVKRLERRATKIRDELESERFYIQRTDNLLDYENKAQKNDEQIAQTVEGIRNYFGEDSNETPPNLTPEQGVYYRRRRILRIDGDKLTRILGHWRRKDFQKLEDINRLADENIKTPFRNTRDLLSYIGTGIALCMLGANATNVGCDPLLHLRRKSSELLHLSKATKSTSTLVEAYLCYTILNWPIPARSKDSLDITGLGNVLGKWKEAKSLAKNPQMGQEKRQHTKPIKVLFYIGVEKGTERVWLEQPTDKANLEWFEGVVVNEGQHVSFNIGETTLDNRVEIAAAKISQKSNWHKRVFFALGFTWSGPLAVNISTEDPRLPRSDCSNFGAACPMPPVIPQQPVFMRIFPTQLLQFSNPFMQPRCIQMAPNMPNQLPTQPVYHGYERFGTPPGSLGPLNQRPRSTQHTSRSRSRGRRSRNPSNRGGQGGQ